MSDDDDAPWSRASARRRLARLAPTLPLAVAEAPEFLVSHSNDVWGSGEVVLRICWRGDRARLMREAQLAAALPPVIAWLEADYPALFAGRDLAEGLWLAEMAYTFRHVAFWPPDRPLDRLDRDHPLHRLRRLIDAPIAWA
jgi:hypothetical protein